MTIATLVVAVACLILFPVIASHAGRQYLISVTQWIALTYARDVLSRADRISELMREAISALKAAGDTDPCSPRQMALMRMLALRSPNIKVIGYLKDDQLICSSLGKPDRPIAVGPKRPAETGTLFIRPAMELPDAPGVRFLVAEQDGIAFFISRTGTVDIATSEQGVALATFSPKTRTFRTTRGPVSEAWLTAREPDPGLFVDDGYAVATVISPRFPTGALAAIPLSATIAQQATISQAAIGIGLLLGALVAGAVLFAAYRTDSYPRILKQAVSDRELFLVCQPILDLKTHRWAGAEALLRWRRPDSSVISPDLFIPLIEQAKMMPMVTDHVLALVEEDLRKIVPRLPQFWLSINLSGEDVESTDILERLRRLLSPTDNPTRNIHFEITERKLLNVDIARDVVNRITSLGYEVAIDDFGTGYSNINYLTEMRFNCIKIDKSFIQDIGVDAPTSHVAYHIIEMARSLGLRIIAEGVETPEQLAFLSDHGVDYAQGFLISRPIAIDDVLSRASQPVSAT